MRLFSVAVLATLVAVDMLLNIEVDSASEAVDRDDKDDKGRLGLLEANLKNTYHS